MKNKDRYMEYALFDYKYQLNILKEENKELMEANKKIKEQKEVINYLLKKLEEKIKINNK